MLFGTGLGVRYLSPEWRLRITRLFAPGLLGRAEPAKPVKLRPVRARRTDASTRYATDLCSVITTDNLRFHGPSDLGTADNIVISLTTTPIRAISHEIFDVFDALVSQRRKARKIYLALPSVYKRHFAVDWKSERTLFVDAVARKYGSRIEIVDCEDNGPATKLLGLLGHAAKNSCLAASDTVIVVDDDITYSDELVHLHELCHDLYQCDAATVDQSDVVSSWVPLKFSKLDSLFSDNNKRAVYGWLSFSIKYGKTAELPGFFQETVARLPTSLFHDDAIFSAYLTKLRLYATSIRCAPLKVLSRTGLDAAKGGALRTIPASHYTVRSQIEADLGHLVDPAQGIDPNFQIPQYIAPRSIRNCSSLSFMGCDENVHLVAHYIAENQIVITITVFSASLVGSDLDVSLQLSKDFFRLPIRVSGTKFTIAVETYRPLFEPLSDHAEIPVIQTNGTSIVSLNKFYSVCTILNNAPTHEYFFFDGTRLEKYLEGCFSETVVKAYELLAPGAYKADFFRYLFAYLNPCIYLDVKMVLNAAISAVYHFDQGGQVFVDDVNQGHIYNGFFISRRVKSNVFKYAIILCLDGIIWNDYREDSLSVTGPGILGLAKICDGVVEPRLFKVFDGEDWQNSIVCDQSGVPVINCAYPGYYTEDNYLNERHYHVFWDGRRVFHIPPSYFIARAMEERPNFMNGIDAVLWINLDRAKTRRSATENLFKSIGPVRHMRIEAIDGREALPWGAGSDIDELAQDAEIACCFSHLAALNAARELKGEYFLITEDDISLRFFPFHGPQDLLESIMDRAPGDWDVILLSWIYVSELHREFTDWNRSFDDGFHVAGTAAYLINRSALEKIGGLFEMRGGKFHVRKPDKQRKLQDGRWLVSDVFIYSNLTTYVYKNKIFSTQNKDSYIHREDVAWHSRTQNVTFNYIGDEIILGSRAEEINLASRVALSSRS